MGKIFKEVFEEFSSAQLGEGLKVDDDEAVGSLSD